MTASRHHLPVKQVIAVAVLAVAIAAPVSLQAGDKAGARAFLAFLQSVAARSTARLCERGIPDYRERFDSLFARWSEKYHDDVAQGEVLFREAARNKDQPSGARGKIEQMERTIEALSRSPLQTGPLTLDEGTQTACEGNLSELEAGLR